MSRLLSPSPLTRLASTALLALLALAPACGDGGSGGPRLPVGSICSANGQCEAGVCGGGQCLEPMVDSDSDGLLNTIEAALGTDPTEQDTDRDGVVDFAEVVEVGKPRDSDGDRRIDAVESRLADRDQDCIPDQLDPDDARPDPSLDDVADRVCCCGGRCSTLPGAPRVTGLCASNTPSPMSCGRTIDCDLGASCEARPGLGQCVSADPLATIPAVVLPCSNDADCSAGFFCESQDFSGTCVAADGLPPALPPTFTCVDLDDNSTVDSPSCFDVMPEEPLPLQ
ncbi:MAG: hypothetical protein KC635_26030 [Myxococcales bacterium]|nr:hypothetical protein [Myxococcales bacterium]MCB9735712.1 hypothetical protein [Deltaproteobacteria bacterium]